ncbi:hypothetical protein [Stutzerimonas stutzeri]|uniref:hypothetical protein n=1 Tax=Stutzerimonas stutzeri TaxID=316 RepID=UPI0015E311BB|nr:hypothetical protein [Stutzerimonas stutzeri]
MSRNDKVMCQCCGKMMVPKVITSAPFYVSGIPMGGRRPEYSVCPFCLSPKWMLTYEQVNAGASANVEFAIILILLLVVMAAFLRIGIVGGCLTLAAATIGFFFRKGIKQYLKTMLTR